MIQGFSDGEYRGALRFRPVNKLSLELGWRSQSAFLVEFHADVDTSEAEAIISGAGLERIVHPDLAPHHVLVRGSRSQMVRLTEWDEVAYIFPASRELLEGAPVQACANLLSPTSGVGQYVATVGEGWDGPGLGGADLKYAYGPLTTKVPRELLVDAVERALAEWRRAARLTFTFSDITSGTRTLALSFAAGAHGDPYPFDGRGRTLAHTYYPAGVNLEPMAGDLHFDDDENWQIGADMDVFSVVVHEMGHALGLGHNDRPGTVMYPYYTRVNQLTAEDIATIQTLYAAPGTEAPAASPLSIQTTLQLATSASTIDLTGKVNGGTDEVRMSWTSSTGQNGVPEGVHDWRIPSVLLAAGDTTVRVVATDSAGASVTATITITRLVTTTPPPAPSPTVDRTAPVLYIRTPSSTSAVTRSATIRIAGTASDNVGVTRVSWSCSTGSSGVAAGTTTWEAASVPLLVGTNVITVQARDAAGNVTTRLVSILRQP